MPDLLETIQRTAIDPAMELLPESMNSKRARLMMLAIGLQESRFTHRAQVVSGGGKGPALGLWQFERGGGVKGVLTHNQTRPYALKVCAARGVSPDSPSVWLRLESDDVLAAAFARLLLYSDPFAMPSERDPDAAWRLYADRTWRPGKPHRSTWDAFHAQARKAVGL